MPQELRELLDPRILSASYAQRDKTDNNELVGFYFNDPTPTDGDEFEIVFYPALMTPVPLNTPGAEARQLAIGQGQGKKAGIIYDFSEKTLPAEILQALREPDSWQLQDRGREALNFEMSRFSRQQEITKELSIALTLAFGHFGIDAQGNIRPPTEDSNTGVLTDDASTVTPVDFGVDNSHRGNLGGLIDKLWTDPSAKIADQLDLVRNAAEAANAEVPTEIWVHNLTKRYLRNNDQFLEWAQYNQVSTTAVLSGSVINDLWGFNWHFYGRKYRDPVTSAMVDFLPQTKAIITPPPTNEGWCQQKQGLSLIPTSINIEPDALAALSKIEKVYGRFAYAQLTANPVQLKMYAGDKWGLYFADTNAIWTPTISTTVV